MLDRDLEEAEEQYTMSTREIPSPHKKEKRNSPLKKHCPDA
jgi:hypothetical protein